MTAAEAQRRAATPAAGVPSGAPAAGVPAVATRGLAKVYGDRVALHGLDLTVEPGEVFGLLGANGAGKTTTVKILTGLVAASEGEARIFGVDVADPQARRHVGYLPELFRFQEWLTGEQLLDLHGRLIGMTTPQRRDAIPRALERVGLAGRGHERIRGYSKGMTQRVGLAQALLGEPALVLLDEPTSALDPVGRRDVRDLIRALRDEGVAVLLNSHLLGEVELVCDRVAIVHHGRVAFSGRLEELTAASPVLRLTVDPPDPALLHALSAHGNAQADADGSVTLRLHAGADAAAVADTVVRGGWRLSALVPVTPTLEEAFVRLVGGETQ